MPKQSSNPTMQDLSDPASLISQAFKQLRPPEGAFDPDGSWSHEYRDGSSHHLKSVQGGLKIQRRPGGKLHIENYRQCREQYRSYTIATLQCRSDELSTPTAWDVESKVARSAAAPAYLNSGLSKRAVVEGGTLALQTGKDRRSHELNGKYTCKWCLLDAVQRLPRLGTSRVEFTLLDEYDELCPNQVLSLQGQGKARTKAGEIEVTAYQHTGNATVPGVFYVDANGRLLVYLAGMQLLVLTNADGKPTEYMR